MTVCNSSPSESKDHLVERQDTVDLTGIDPFIAGLTARLAEATAKNAATAVLDQIKAVKTARDKQEAINKLEGMVFDLIDERSEALQIAKEFEQEFIAQRISNQDIQYIIDTVIPAVREATSQYGAGENAVEAEKLQTSIDALSPLFSTRMLTVLQLLGFNYKKAIGEPLTLYVQKAITSRMPTDPQTAREIDKLNAIGQVELLKIAQDEEATTRLKRVLATWRGTD